MYCNVKSSRRKKKQTIFSSNPWKVNYKNVDSFIWIQDLSLPFFGDRNIQSKRNLGIVIMIIIMPLGEASKKKNWFFSEFIRKGGRGVSPNPKFPNQKMIEIFLDFFAERGGGLTQSKISVIRNCLFFFWKWRGGLSQSKISLSEKAEIFVGFFCQKGGGSHPIQNFC